MTSQELFERVMNAIDKIREPGEKPEDDLYSLDKFVCDLCQGVKEREEITQCGFCGRWVCRDKDHGEKDCWNDELKACESCSGVIQLARKEEIQGETDLIEEDDLGNKSTEADEDE